MNSTKLWMAAQTAPCFGMPISGHTFDVMTPATDARTTRTAVAVRERAAIAATKGGTVKGGLGLAQSYFPGTSAWRPPTC